ncbi:MAG: hypothetical protein HQL09_09735 [Nitrospirae bacterium]|nr:hypothetical protein [Nitrospirota bacterium]
MIKRIARIIRMVTVVVLAGTGILGCATDISNRAAYDKFYADSAVRTVPAKYVFDVPYTKIKFGQKKCDSSYAVAALEDVYGVDIAFGHTPEAYSVKVKDLVMAEFAVFGHHTADGMVADVTINGKTTEMIGVYYYNAPWSLSYPEAVVKAICSGTALDLAHQIKAITNAENRSATK